MAEAQKTRNQYISARFKTVDAIPLKLENSRPRSPNGTPLTLTENKGDSMTTDNNLERKSRSFTDSDITTGSLKIYGAEGLFSNYNTNVCSSFKGVSSITSVNSNPNTMERPIFISSESKQNVSNLKANFEQQQHGLYGDSHKQHIAEFANPLHRGGKKKPQKESTESLKAVKPPVAPKPASPLKKPATDLKCHNQKGISHGKPMLYEEIPPTLSAQSNEPGLRGERKDALYSEVVHHNGKAIPTHPPPRQVVQTAKDNTPMHSDLNITCCKQLDKNSVADKETEKENESKKSTEIPIYAQVNKNKKSKTLDTSRIARNNSDPALKNVTLPGILDVSVLGEEITKRESTQSMNSNEDVKEIPTYAQVNKYKMSKTLDTSRKVRSDSDPTKKNVTLPGNLDISVIKKETTLRQSTQSMDSNEDAKDSGSEFDDDDEPPWDPDEFDDDSDSDGNDTEHDSRSTSQEENQEDMVFPDEKSKKLYNIAKEILTTERAYVRRLYLLDQVFYFRLENECVAHGHVPKEVMQDVFSNITAIHKFHKDFLLPLLEERMSEWSTNNTIIGDILKKLAPFLKLYTAYIANFDKSAETLAIWTKKSPKFASIIEDIQKSGECENLTLGHHMLEPIQRVPRYKLLLRDYLAKLSEDSQDYKNCQDAMEIISEAAAHANDSMKKNERFKKLLELQDRLLEDNDLITASRQFIKEGDLTKVAARSSTGHQERTLLMFNDILMCCSKVPGTNKLKVKVTMDLDGMEIGDADEDVELSNTFRITSKQKVIDFSASSEEDRDNWIKALNETIQEFVRKRESYKRGIQSKAINECDLGKKAPVWVRDESVTMCMSCDTMFTITRRRHHCRACGRIFCNACCHGKAALEYTGNKLNRVCQTCYKILKGAKGSVLKKKAEEKKTLDVRKIDSQSKVLLSGYLNYRGSTEKSWVKRWCVLSDTFVFYCYKAKKDTKAAFSIPLPGYVVDKPNLADDIDKKIAFKLHHKNVVVHYFAPDGQELLTRWMHNLSYAVKAERIPEKELDKTSKEET